jgi:hypothetical protein
LDRELVFSFKFYDEDNDKKYCLSSFEKKQVRTALERLRELNRTSVKDLHAKRTFYNFHEVYWDQTTIKSGFRNSNLKELDPFQFSLAGVNGQKTRVFGAISGFTFYIVWFDLNHLIWPSFKKGT